MYRRRNQHQLRDYQLTARATRLAAIALAFGVMAVGCGGDGPPPPEVEVDVTNSTESLIFMTPSPLDTFREVLARLQLAGDPVSIGPGQTLRLGFSTVGPHTDDGGCIQGAKWFFTSTAGMTRWIDNTGAPPTDAQLETFVLVERWAHGEVCFTTDIAAYTIK